MLTLQEVELLGALLSRAGVNPYEALWANSVLDRLRTLALEQQAKAALGQEEKPDQAEAQ